MTQSTAQQNPHIESAVEICTAENLVILSPQGKPLTQALNFSLPAGSHTAIVGQSGAGKTSLFNAILGFLAYQGSLKINGIELKR